MKITNQEVLNFAGTSFGSKHLPVRISYAISKNADAIAGALKAYEETRKNLLERFAKKDEEGKAVIENGNYVIDDMEQFAKEMNELLTVETEVIVQEVSIDEFAKCDEAGFDRLTVSEMAILKFMIKD